MLALPAEIVRSAKTFRVSCFSEYVFGPNYQQQDVRLFSKQNSHQLGFVAHHMHLCFQTRVFDELQLAPQPDCKVSNEVTCMTLLQWACRAASSHSEVLSRDFQDTGGGSESGDSSNVCTIEPRLSRPHSLHCPTCTDPTDGSLRYYVGSCCEHQTGA